MSNDASTVGSFDLGIYKNTNNENEVLKNLQNNFYEVVYLLGVDDDSISEFYKKPPVGVTKD